MVELRGYNAWLTREPDHGDEDPDLCACGEELTPENKYGERFCEVCDATECDCCGEKKVGCEDLIWASMDTHACPACRGKEDDYAADRGDWQCHQERDR